MKLERKGLSRLYSAARSGLEPTLFFPRRVSTLNAPALSHDKEQIADRVRAVSERVARGAGLEFVDLELKKGPRGPLLRVFLDKPGRIGLDDIENASREISAILDVEDPIASAYTLEVSSPGMTRMMKTPRDFERAMGKLVRVSYHPTIDGEKANAREVVGRIESVTGEHFQIVPIDAKGREGGAVEVTFSSVVFARREIVFGSR